MRIILSSRIKKLSAIIAAFYLFIAIVLNLVGYILDCKYISAIAAVEQINKYEVRSDLLMRAMDQVGVCYPEDAARVWANGLKMRSAAMQYSVMSKSFKELYASELEENAPNWVTGMSSPWVDSYEIVKIEPSGEDSTIIELAISTATSTGPFGTYKAVLTIVKEGGFWRIKKIHMDRELYPYTGFQV